LQGLASSPKTSSKPENDAMEGKAQELGCLKHPVNASSSKYHEAPYPEPLKYTIT
jgi:hypothetical protein